MDATPNHAPNTTHLLGIAFVALWRAFPFTSALTASMIDFASSSFDSTGSSFSPSRQPKHKADPIAQAMLARAMRLPNCDETHIENVKAAIANGTYLDEEKLDAALDALLEELIG